MRTPSLFKQCLPDLVPQDRRLAQSMSMASDKEMHLPSPAVEIIPSMSGYPSRYIGENIDWQGVNVFKGKVSVLDIIGQSRFPQKLMRR